MIHIIIGEPIRAEKQDTFVEEDPSGNLVDQWPPKYIFDRENRNNEKVCLLEEWK